MVVGGQRHAPAALPLAKTRYLLYRRLCGPQGRSGRVRKVSLPPEFDPRTVRPVASRYTDWAIPAPEQFVVRKVSGDGNNMFRSRIHELPKNLRADWKV